MMGQVIEEFGNAGDQITWEGGVNSVHLENETSGELFGVCIEDWERFMVAVHRIDRAIARHHKLRMPPFWVRAIIIRLYDWAAK